MTEYANCPDAEELAAWIDGELDDAARRRLAAHLDSCERCAEVVDGVLAFQDEEALAEDGVGSDLADEPAPSEAEFTPPPPAVETPGRRWRPYFAVALAACAVVWAVRVGPLAPAPGGQDFSKLAELKVVRGSKAKPEWVQLCATYFKTPDAPPEWTEACLKVAASDSYLAEFVVEDPRFATWLADPDLRAPACGSLLQGWPGLPGSPQKAWRDPYEACKAFEKGP